MRTSVENVSGVELKLSVEVPAPEVDAEYARQLKAIRKQARVKGFRPGKAPAKMVKRLYADYLASETARALITATVGEAIQTVPRQVLGEPAFEPATVTEGEPLTYGVHLQVKPELTIERWDAMEISVAPAVLDEAAVEGQIQSLREGQKEQVPVVDRGADTGDVLQCHCNGEIDGEPDPRLHLHQFEVKLGTTELIPGFADELMGAKAGETRSFDIVFPEDYHAEEMAGKEASFTVEVKEHYVEELPELDDDFAMDIGHDSVSAMTESVRTELQATADKHRDHEVESRLIALLLERNEFEAPPIMTQSQMEYQARQMYRMLGMQGLPPDKARSILEGSRDSLAADAAQSVRRYLALEALATQESLEIDDDAIDAEIGERTKDAPDHIKAEYARDEVRDSVRVELLERAALDLLKSRAIISDAAPIEEADENDAAPSAPSQEGDDAPQDSGDDPEEEGTE